MTAATAAPVQQSGKKNIYQGQPQRVPALQGTISEGERIQFDCQGFIILRGVLDPETLVRFQAELERLEHEDYDDSDWRHDETGMPTKAVFGEALRLNGLPRLSPVFDEVIGHPRLMPYLDEFVTDPMLINTWYINKLQGKGEVGWHSGLDPHQHYSFEGRPFTAMLNTIWALDENNEDTGCPIALPGSHKRSFNFKQRYQGLDMPGSIPVILHPGDVFVFSEATMHGGLPRSVPGSRKNLYINYVEGVRGARSNDSGNLHHYWLPPEVRARFPEEKQRLFKWMEHNRGA